MLLKIETQLLGSEKNTVYPDSRKMQFLGHAHNICFWIFEPAIKLRILEEITAF